LRRRRQLDRGEVGLAGDIEAPVSMNSSCANGTTVSGQSVYVVGNAPRLGAWAAGAVTLNPTSHPIWTGTIGGTTTGSF
jgi:alpha-glucosidase